MRKLIVILFLAPSIALCQTENLIRNDGFEYKTNEAETYEPNEVSQFKFVDYWEEDIFKAPANNTEYPPELGRNMQKPMKLTTSDRFKLTTFDRLKLTSVNRLKLTT
jgi:hypothetical protein